MATTSGREAGLRLRGFSGKWLEERPGLQGLEFTGNWYYLSPILTHHSSILTQWQKKPTKYKEMRFGGGIDRCYHSQEIERSRNR